MDKAIIADKKNPLPMYQKANILMSLERFDEALAVLEEVKEYSPRESSVYALMGKIYKRRNMHEKAMLHFGFALDLKPSATDVATIKVIWAYFLFFQLYLAPREQKNFALLIPYHLFMFQQAAIEKLHVPDEDDDV